MAIKSDIVLYEEVLKEYKQCEKILTGLSPAQWKDDQIQKKINQKACRKKLQVVLPQAMRRLSIKPTRGGTLPDLSSALPRKSIIAMRKLSAIRHFRRSSAFLDKGQTDDSESEEELELYFTAPKQLLDAFVDLEDQNISLTKYAQELDEDLKALRRKNQRKQKAEERKISILKEQVESLTEACIKKEKKVKKLKAGMFSLDGSKPDTQAAMLQTIKEKIAEVYKACIGEIQGPFDAMNMLAGIEHCFEEILEKLELMPPDILEVAEKRKLREQKKRAHVEKLKKEELYHEQRRLSTLQRALADTKRKEGRKLMIRSDPPSIKQKTIYNEEMIRRMQEEEKYFFT
ncbi:coiled-coil domain-containing protein 38 [Pelobates fuscus]|uniref:coiled-coil domain-containing protein 38 n=1 Tax=Pelobates fuscus TaxID=191477 RepID=UPI002FE4F3AC